MGDESLQRPGGAELFEAFVSSSTCRAALCSFGQLSASSPGRPTPSGPSWSGAPPTGSTGRAEPAGTPPYASSRSGRSRSPDPSPDGLFSVCGWSVCGHRGGAMRPADGGGAELHGSSGGPAGEERRLLPQQRAAPVALRHPRPARPRRQEVLREVLRRRHRPHQIPPAAAGAAEGGAAAGGGGPRPCGVPEPAGAARGAAEPRFQKKGVPREAGHRHHRQLQEQEHLRRGPGGGDQRRGLHLQPEVLPGLRQHTGIDLENIVYYKDDTHYFVMTAKKQNLLEKGVILQDFADTELLLSRDNVDQSALQAFARQAADFSTNQQLPSLDFAINHYGQPDVAMFDFTCMYASQNAAMVRQRHGHRLLVTLVGDSLLEPFWPMGTGIARGFLAALDSAWMVRRWSEGGAPLDVLAERESLYRLLPQTTPENLQKNFALFTVDPTTRYANVNQLLVTPAQVLLMVQNHPRVFCACAGVRSRPAVTVASPSVTSPLPGGVAWPFAPSSTATGPTSCRTPRPVLLCPHLSSSVLTCPPLSSSVLLCPHLSSPPSSVLTCPHLPSSVLTCPLPRPVPRDFDSLDQASGGQNARLGLDLAEQELGICPLVSVEEMSSEGGPDWLSMVMYLSQFHQLFKDTPPPAGQRPWTRDLSSEEEM
ncbi:unnamed protein product, partial [Tetraodon nigroviridis]